MTAHRRHIVWRFASWWIRRRVPADKADPILGDLAEDYRERLRTRTRVTTTVWLIRECRSMISAYGNDRTRGGRWRGIGQDLTYSVRVLRRHKGFALTAVLTLALGVGANIAVFSAVRTVLLSDLPYPDADRLVTVSLKTTQAPAGDMAFTIAAFEALTERQSLFSHLGGTAGGGVHLFASDDNAEVVQTRRISEAFGHVSGLRPIQGRLFTSGDFTPGSRVALVSESFWTSRLGGNQLSDLTVRLDEGFFNIVGIVPAAFDLAGQSDQPAQIWLPHAWSAKDRSPASGNFNLRVVGRLADGLSFEDAQRKLAALDGTWPSEHPTHRVEGARLAPLHERYAAPARSGLLLLQGIAVLLLLITCSNLAHLFLAHTSVRQQEFVVRTALGAGDWRVARLLISEAGLVAIAGGLLGVFLATMAVPVLVTAASWALPRASEVEVNAVDLGVGLALACVTVLIFGVLPTWMSSRGDLLQTLRGSATATASRRTRLRRGALVAAQVALATVLLTAGGLLTRSFYRVTSLPLGFDASGLMVATVVDGPGATFTPGRTTMGAARILDERMRAHFGPGNVAVGGSMPYSSTRMGPGAPYTPTGYPEGTRSIPYRSASQDYFSLLQIPVLRGRAFSLTDVWGAPRVAIVNEQFVREFSEGRELLGQAIRIGPRDVTIVGIVGDTRFTSASPPEAAVYWPAYQDAATAVILRTTNMESTVRELREVVRSISPALVVVQPEMVEAKIARQLAQRRFYFLMVTLLAGLGLTLTSLGIWGVVTHLTRRRTRESAIRVALGARGADVTRLVMRQGLAPVVVGLVMGLLAAWWAAQALKSNTLFQAQLYEMNAVDPATFLAAGTCLLVIAGFACWLPASRASRVDPAAVLRAE